MVLASMKTIVYLSIYHCPIWWNESWLQQILKEHPIPKLGEANLNIDLAQLRVVRYWHGRALDFFKVFEAFSLVAYYTILVRGGLSRHYQTKKSQYWHGTRHWQISICMFYWKKIQFFHNWTFISQWLEWTIECTYAALSVNLLSAKGMGYTFPKQQQKTKNSNTITNRLLA